MQSTIHFLTVRLRGGLWHKSICVTLAAEWTLYQHAGMLFAIVAAKHAAENIWMLDVHC